MLLSSHSSQLINVLFSHPSSSMIEVSSEFFNADFAEYAHGMGVFFEYALGGTVVDGNRDAKQEACTAELAACDGDSYCILNRRHLCNKGRSMKNKPKDFVANLTAVRQAVMHAKRHLDWACMGRW